MQTITKIALDAMGGDNAPAEVVKGAVDAVKARDDIKVFLVGQKDSVQAELEKYTYPSEQIELIDAPEVIEMAEPPVIAIRRKRQSSIVVGMNMVKQKEADAFVSARKLRSSFSRRTGDSRKNKRNPETAACASYSDRKRNIASHRLRGKR